MILNSIKPNNLKQGKQELKNIISKYSTQKDWMIKSEWRFGTFFGKSKLEPTL